MLRSIFFAAVLMLPFAASAITLHEGGNWRDCTSDDDCIAIKGTCTLTGVNMEYKDGASAYYQQQAAKTKCTNEDEFWKPKAELVRCYLGRCEMYAKPVPSKKKMNVEQ